MGCWVLVGWAECSSLMLPPRGSARLPWPIETHVGSLAPQTPAHPHSATVREQGIYFREELSG